MFWGTNDGISVNFNLLKGWRYINLKKLSDLKKKNLNWASYDQVIFSDI